MDNILWGIIGCGGVAGTFATSLRALGKGHLLAAASRTERRAAEFAELHGIERVYTDYESLAADPDIDAVYIATTHNFHYENAELCLKNGKHVLCEKSFTINAKQTRELMELAREKKLFIMEAVWTRFLPAIVKLQNALADGVIGEIRTVTASFCLGREFPDEGRLKNPALAGGALLDLGIYPITFADLVFGQSPECIQSSVVKTNTGVDESSFYYFDYEGGRRAVLFSSLTNNMPNEGIISGTEGYIRVPLFWAAKQFHIHRSDEEPEIVSAHYEDGENFRFEIGHAMQCISGRKTESDIHSLSDTLRIMKIMDTLRAQWDFRFPEET